MADLAHTNKQMMLNNQKLTQEIEIVKLNQLKTLRQVKPQIPPTHKPTGVPVSIKETEIPVAKKANAKHKKPPVQEQAEAPRKRRR